MTPAVEVVLPSGRFARMRKPKALDLLTFVGSNRIFEAHLIAQCLTIDDEKLSYEQVLDLDIEEAMPIVGQLNQFLRNVKLGSIL